ncbi:hypothetical protein PBV87_03025 [Niameybacter massiliensis]|uniref:Uncharacterized protein n=1 Tax=Holtiella tumoricola TaxID=3018743 RepID=A0AA42DKD1_9FIRM|nr:hypothetical protein [Holtiella tumoricola]MDA3730479.1 hypothetical protein [Holtiella tumoricola]
MIGVLFGINALLALIVTFTTRMLQNHFEKINKSIQVYLNPKAYKTESEIDFIRNLIDKYQRVFEAQNGENIEVETMVQNAFYEKRIGRFSYITIQNIALKSKLVMWGALSIQVFIEILSKSPGSSIKNFIFIIASTILCLIISLMGVIKNIVEEREQLFIKIQDFMINTYPSEMKWKDKQKDVKALLARIEELEAELEQYHMGNEKLPQATQINEEDIKILLSKIDL